MAGCLCDQCAALCCRYFALPIDNPEDKRDYDNIRWYLLHDKVVVFVEKEQWYIGVLTKCRALQADNRCGIYETRPAICRGYSTDNCDYHAGDYGYDRLFTSAEALWEYATAKLRDEKVAKVKRAKARRRVVTKLDKARAISGGVPVAIGPSAAKPRAVGPKPQAAGRALSLPILGE